MNSFNVPWLKVQDKTDCRVIGRTNPNTIKTVIGRGAG